MENNNLVQIVCGVRAYEQDGVAYLHIEDVARGLGFTEQKDGVDYVRWRTVDSHLSSLSFATCCENGNPHDYYIPENIFYRLCMKARNETAEKFQAKVADEIIPSIRKHGVYATEDFIQKSIEDPDWAISMLLQVKHEREKRALAEAQRDEAIRTKAWIGSKRESTCMNEVKRYKGENKRLVAENTDLQIRIGEAESYKTVKQLTWLREYFVFIDPKQWNYTTGAVGNELKRISIIRDRKIERAVDPNWGECNSYHIDIINEFREKLEADRNYMDNRNKRKPAYPIRRL